MLSGSDRAARVPSMAHLHLQHRPPHADPHHYRHVITRHRDTECAWYDLCLLSLHFLHIDGHFNSYLFIYLFPQPTTLQVFHAVFLTTPHLNSAEANPTLTL